MKLEARRIAHRPHNNELRVEVWYILCPACGNEDVWPDYDPDSPIGQLVCGNRECCNRWERIA